MLSLSVGLVILLFVTRCLPFAGATGATKQVRQRIGGAYLGKARRTRNLAVPASFLAMSPKLDVVGRVFQGTKQEDFAESEGRSPTMSAPRILRLALYLAARLQQLDECFM